jgi:cation diffusion facilitator family transporter
MTAHEEKDHHLRQQAALISVLVGFGMLALKTTAYFLTHSTAILSDAIESIVHVFATSIAFYSIVVSSRPADESHPYGHGKVEFFSAGLEGGLIVVAAIAIMYTAIRDMIFGRELVDLDVGMLFILAASVVNLLLGWFLINRGRATDSLTLVADGKHVLTDSYTSFGVVAGLGLVYLTGIKILDPLVAIAVAINIVFSGYKLMRVSVGGLMDESDKQTLERINGIINRARTPEWINLHHLRIMRSGRMHNLDFHLIIPFYWSVEEAHTFQGQVVRRISSELQDNATVLIHLDPCTHSYCPSCSLEPCKARAAQFVEHRPWTTNSMTGDPPFISDGDERDVILQHGQTPYDH